MNDVSVVMFAAEIELEQMKDIVFIVPITVYNSRVMFLDILESVDDQSLVKESS
jgi:hypothetical protein